MAGLTITEFLVELKHDAASDSALRTQMVKWKREALESINDGKGAQVVSGSGNGLAYTASQLGMNNVQWYTALGRVLREIEASTTLPSRTLGRIV